MLICADDLISAGRSLARQPHLRTEARELRGGNRPLTASCPVVRP
jgi:hypothetical protein